MITTRWEPFSEMQAEMGRLRGEMDRVFGRFGLPLAGANGRQSLAPTQYPAVNLWEDGDNYYAEAELPGIGMDDLEIYVNGGTQLIIKGERKEPACEQGAWHRRERGYGKFAKTLELPSPVNEESVAASLKQGVLMVTLPKREEAKPRRIEVKAD